MWTWKTGKRFPSLPYYPTFHTFTFPSPSPPSFKNLVLHRYQLAMPRLSRGGYRRIRSVCHICQPTVSEISHEMTSYFAQVLFSVCPMAPLLEKSRLSPGHGAPVSIISWPCLACHVVNTIKCQMRILKVMRIGENLCTATIRCALYVSTVP